MPCRRCRLLKLYRECGGEIITIGSDAHKAEYIGFYQKEAHEMLETAGFQISDDLLSIGSRNSLNCRGGIEKSEQAVADRMDETTIYF